MMGCRVVLLIEAGSPRLSLSDGHTSMESAPPGCSSLLVPCEDAGLLRGGWLLGTVNEDRTYNSLTSSPAGLDLCTTVVSLTTVVHAFVMSPNEYRVSYLAMLDTLHALSHDPVG
ncbi:hypothetical protein MTO96_027332 [Rhipicephalus appendiculatus]